MAAKKTKSKVKAKGAKKAARTIKAGKEKKAKGKKAGKVKASASDRYLKKGSFEQHLNQVLAKGNIKLFFLHSPSSNINVINPTRASMACVKYVLSGQVEEIHAEIFEVDPGNPTATPGGGAVQLVEHDTGTGTFIYCAEVPIGPPAGVILPLQTRFIVLWVKIAGLPDFIPVGPTEFTVIDADTLCEECDCTQA